MASPRQLVHGQLGRLVARLLILALVAGLLHKDARASTPKSPSVIDSYALSALPTAVPSPPKAAALRILLIVADPSGLTKPAFGELLAHTGSDPQCVASVMVAEA